MDIQTRKRVIDHIHKAMDDKIQKMTIDNPFNPNEVERKNPFGFRLVPIEVWQGSKFERSFVTTLGQGIFEQIGKIIAEGSGAVAENQHRREITLNTFQNETIDSIVLEQTRSQGKRKRIASPDLQPELEKLWGLDSRGKLTVSTISDLYVKRPSGKEEFYSFKTVKPNIDQTAAAKKILLSLRTFNNEFDAYFALPYNPGGEGFPYSKSGHSIPKRLFDMEDENFVLVGSALWNKIGNDPNTYNEVLEVFSEAGEVSSERIRREYFGLDEK